MKIVKVETLISSGPFIESSEWITIQHQIREGVSAVRWPPKAAAFTIYPGRKANGVVPIKQGMMKVLEDFGWNLEHPLDLATSIKPGNLDAVFTTSAGPYALEWETGNVSSSHRALNKMAVGILKGRLIGGTLVVPSRALYQYLTDRIGNYDELAPYLDLWKSIACPNGVLEIVVVEHDATDLSVKKIRKGTDGRARR